MALQTESATDTSAAASTSATDANGTGGDDTNGILPGDNTAPLVPAFLLTGVLLIAIVALCWWKRRSSPGSIMFAGATGAGSRFMVSTRAGYAGSFGPFVGGSWEPGTHGPGGRREKELGPKPELWDAYIEMQGLGKDKAAGELRWRDMKVRRFFGSHSYIPCS